MLTALLVIAGAAPPPKPPASMARTLRQIQARYSGANAFETTKFVAQYWRVPGNPGFDASINRVADLLKRAGYVLQSEAKPGDRLVYRIEHRQMPHPTWEPVGGQVAIAGDAEPLLRYETNRHMLTINSASTPPGGIEAEVIASTGNQLPDSAAVAGKILYAQMPVGRLYTEGVKRGAVGVVAYDLPGYLKPEINQHSIQFSAIPRDTTRAGWGILLSTAAKHRLDDALTKGPVRLRVAIETKQYRAEELTLVAEVRGTKAAEERFVFSAHVQEPGANDNATGVGALAEMARVAVIRPAAPGPDHHLPPGRRDPEHPTVHRGRLGSGAGHHVGHVARYGG